MKRSRKRRKFFREYLHKSTDLLKKKDVSTNETMMALIYNKWKEP